MAKKIGYAIQHGKEVRVFDERGCLMFSKSGDLGGFTSSCVTVNQNGRTSVYDNRNCIKRSYYS